MKAYRRGGDEAPHIQDLGIRHDRSPSYSSHFTWQGKNSQYPLNGRLDGPGYHLNITVKRKLLSARN
jgi:hypothetical protein